MSSSTRLPRQPHFLQDPVIDLIDVIVQQYITGWLGRFPRRLGGNVMRHEDRIVCDRVIDEAYTKALFLFNRISAQQTFIIQDSPGASDYALSRLLQRNERHFGIGDVDTLAHLQRWRNNMRTPPVVETLANPLPLTTAAHQQLLKEIGRTWVAYLLGNAEALSTGKPLATLTIGKLTWQETPLQQQLDVMHYLQRQFLALSFSDQERSFKILEGSGCRILFW